MALGTRRLFVADLGVDRDSGRKDGGDHFRLPGHGRAITQSAPALGRLAAVEALLRRAMSGAMGAGMRMMTARLSMGQIQRVSSDVSAHTAAQLDVFAATAIPGLLQAV